MPHRLCLLLVGLALLVLPAGCGGDDRPTLERIKAEGTVTIGLANEAPYAWVDGNDVIRGEAPAVLRHVLGEMGVTDIKAVPVDFGALIPGLQAGRFDIIAAGMYIKPERAAKVLFTDPTYRIGEGFIVRAGNPKGLHSYEDVANHADAVLGVVNGTVEIGYAEKCGVPEDRLKTFANNQDAAEAVAAGRIDAFGGTELTVQTLLQRLDNENLEKADPFSNPVIDGRETLGYGAFAVRNEDTALRDAINEKLAGFLGTDEHLALVEPYGFTRDNLPGMTAGQVLEQQRGDADAN